MKIAYQAYDTSGQEFTNTIEAPDAGSAKDMLHRKGLYVTKINEAESLSAKKTGKVARTSRGARQLKDLAVFTRQLSVLVSSGTPLVESLSALQRQVSSGSWQDTISAIRSHVEEGATLSQALEAHSGYFDSTYRSLITAGESSGDLAAMLDRLAVLKKKELSARNLLGAMVYPSLLIVMAAGVLTLLLTLIVPRFAELFETLDVPLPASTKVLLVLSGLFRTYWWAMLLALAGLVIGLMSYLRTPGGKRTWDTFVLRVPKLGDMVKGLAMARVTRLLSVLLQAHVPVLEALRLTRHATGNVHYSELVTRAEDYVSRGEPICTAFTDSHLVSPSICETIRSGEQSGQIGPLLVHIADFLDEENDTSLRALTTILEPVILIFMGLVVGVVAISLFMPLFDLTSMIQGGPA